MGNFFKHQEKKMVKRLGIIYGGFLCAIMNICINKLVHVMPKKN
jgi:hypothetical protein